MDIETETKEIQNFVDKGNYHAAYNIALSALNACRRESDQVGVDHFINVIREIVESLAEEFSGKSAC